MTTTVSYSSPTALYLGKKIKLRRLALGLTQKEVARRMHMDPSMTQLWEAEKRGVPVARLKSLAQALETTEAELIDETTSTDPKDQPLMAKIEVFSLPIKPPEEPEPAPRPMVYPYRLACWQCSDEVHVRLTTERARLLCASGLLRCGKCRSASVGLESNDLGGYSGVGRYGKGARVA